MSAAHVPALAAGEGAAGPRRSLLLAGGGIRVAYQAGVMLALEEAGLRFAHADGTSGGTMNLAMLLSGVGPEEACERWRTLDTRAFVSVWGPGRLLRGPPYPALGTSEGIRRRVFPHLGIDPDRIRAAEGIAGTFNVCDYEAKANVAVPHSDIDLDVLVAGVSLPVFSPAVRRRGRPLLDSVWIKDVNVSEAIRRGADELWLVWCIGNHGVYRDGAFQQYVHMIELSANGSLNEELAMVRSLNEQRERPVVLHVIRPAAPLPLDPDLMLGRIDAGTLVAMGYRDATEYLGRRTEGGVALDPSATRMHDPRPGMAVRERLVGDGLELHVSWEVEDLDAWIADPSHSGALVGDATHPALGVRRPARSGRFWLADRQADGELDIGGVRLRLRRAPGGAVAELGGATIELERSGVPRVHARGVGSAREGAAAHARFWRFLRARS
jgi:predicted acylesterase/phospholipase RssA